MSFVNNTAGHGVHALGYSRESINFTYYFLSNVFRTNCRFAFEMKENAISPILRAQWP